MAPDHTCAIGVPWLAAMTLIENPVLAMPVRPEGRLSFRQFLRLVRENTLGTYPPEAFDDEIIAGRLLSGCCIARHRFGISRIVSIQTDLRPSLHGSPTFRLVRVIAFALAQPLQ